MMILRVNVERLSPQIRTRLTDQKIISMDWASSNLILDLFAKKSTRLRSNMSLFLPLNCTETDNGLTTSGRQVNETIEPALSNS